MKKILNNTASIGVGVIIGILFGFTIATILYKTTILSTEDAYNLGYQKAQQECFKLIKNTK